MVLFIFILNQKLLNRYVIRYVLVNIDLSLFFSTQRLSAVRLL